MAKTTKKKVTKKLPTKVIPRKPAKKTVARKKAAKPENTGGGIGGETVGLATAQTLEERVAQEIEYTKDNIAFNKALEEALQKEGIERDFYPLEIFVDQLQIFGVGRGGKVHRWDTLTGTWKLHKDGV